MSVDKGYIYGRIRRDGVDRHCPEIDILIHDTESYRPVYRLNDFVIVQPEAVLAVIQVKRTLRSGKGGSLSEGIRQAVEARQHLLDMMVAKNPANRGYPTWPDMKQVLSAVVGFEDCTNMQPDTYRGCLHEHYVSNHSLADPRSDYDSSVYVLPNFIGSLTGRVVVDFNVNVGERQYYFFESVQEGRNIALQMLLLILTERLWDFRREKPPFAFGALRAGSIIQVPRPSESLHKREPSASS